jgi:hypothetical protein
VLLGVAVGKKDGALAEREETGSQTRCGDANDVGVVAERSVVELGKLAETTLDARADGGGPENAVLAELQVAIASLGEKSLDLFSGSAGKEKDVVKVALPGKFGLLLR